MPPRIRRLSRRVHRLLTVALVLLFATPVTITWLEWSRQQREDLAREIDFAGGQVTLPPTLFENLRNFAETGEWNSDTEVWLSGSGIDDHWLREHDHLQDLNITTFVSSEQEFEADVITRLIDEHPIRVLSLREQRNSDAVAAALSHKRGLLTVEFGGSDLTDVGLQRLPLEQLEFLDVSRTRVTRSELLDSLPRSRCLGTICLDGLQVDADVVEILESITTLQYLVFFGPDITDEHVEMLRPLTNLSHVQFRDAAITRTAVNQLEGFLPRCKVSVYPPLDDEE